LISEAYGIGENHSSIITAAKLAKDSNSKLLALVHIFRKINIDKEMEMARKIFTPIIIPKEFDVVWI
jgi:ribonuclease BN (tRNA processing enzyme)